ncbi:MAG: hypothetical protein R2756_05845 [Bacteroidales bacterium]
MNQSEQPLEDIRVIRKLMEESSRFLSLSGLSGIIAGVVGLAGAWIAHLVIKANNPYTDWYLRPLAGGEAGNGTVLELFGAMAIVLLVAFSAAVVFSSRKAKKSGVNAWTPVTRRMLVSLLVPLAAGGLFVLFTVKTVPANVTAASTLIFYGVAMMSAGKFTFGEIHWLGALEVVTGLVCILLPQWTIIIWAAGFGVIHICYGLFMHLRYKG